MAMTDIERRIRVEQEWARRNVMADHLNGQRYIAYNWRRDLRDLTWELGTINWTVPHWKEPTREINFELDWGSLRASSDSSSGLGAPMQKAKRSRRGELFETFRDKLLQISKFFRSTCGHFGQKSDSN